MKKNYLIIALLLFISQLAQAQWTTSGNDIWNSNVGNVSVGNNSSSFPAKFNVYLSVPLGTTPQNNTMLTSITGSAGNNTFKNNLWIVRNTAGTGWATARLHDGISIDVSFLNPQVDTKTWWERDPNADIQAWGTAASTYLTLRQGRVGIGTVSPGARLEVAGSTATGASMFIDNNQLSANRNPVNGNVVDATRGSAAIVLSTSSVGGNMQFHTGAIAGGTLAERMRLNEIGYLGIGTTTPQAKLDVTGGIFIGSNNLDKADLGFLANSGKTLIGWNRSHGGGETDFVSNQWLGNMGGFAFYNYDNNNTENQLMLIQGNGNVAIGTTDPKGYKLAVNGSVIATSVRVKLNSAWPDFVFKKNYRLPALSEVESYIDQHQHLPEIPSEQQIVKDGLNLGEMNKLLLKKVEELTLYMIETQKQLQKQQAEIDQLKAAREY